LRVAAVGFNPTGSHGEGFAQGQGDTCKTYSSSIAQSTRFVKRQSVACVGRRAEQRSARAECPSALQRRPNGFPPGTRTDSRE
jgi:hypothetical protein